MKQRILVVAAIAMIPLALGAQQPPTPPVTPTPVTPAMPGTPVAAPAPGQRPLVAITPMPGDPLIIDGEAIRRAVEDAKWQGQLAAEEGRRIAEDAKWQGQLFADQARRFAEDFKFDFKHDFKFEAPHVSVNVPGFNYTPMPQQGGSVLWTPQQKWQDPADSAYEVALQTINRYDYSRAAVKFADFIAKYPGSKRVPQAAYYQALALYRVGTMETLRGSLKVLEANQQTFQYGYGSGRTSPQDVPALHARVLRALSERGDKDADGKLRDLIAKYPAERCDRDKIDIQGTVLNSLYQADPEAAAPYIKQYLETKDGCTARLRETAIYLLANRGTEANTNLIAQIAKTDTVRSVRSRAIEVLSRMPGDAAITALQQLMGDDDDDIRLAAIRSLMRSDNPRAKAAMRQTLIDNKNAPERQRTEAINNLSRDNMSPDDAAYLRTLFNRAGESDRIKESIVNALGNVPTEENMKFLLDVAQNANEASSVRNTAFRRVTSRQNLSTENLIKLFDATDNKNMRNSIVDALAQRPEQAALDKLLSIVKSSTDSDVRSNAIQELLRKNDKNITQKVLDLIGKPGGL
jgi:HEAT repeat protein